MKCCMLEVTIIARWSEHIHRADAASSVPGTIRDSVEPAVHVPPAPAPEFSPPISESSACSAASARLAHWNIFLLDFTFGTAAQPLRSVCHTPAHKRLHLYGSCCSKCAVIAESHMDLGVFGISGQICASAVGVVTMLRPPPPPVFSPFGC